MSRYLFRVPFGTVINGSTVAHGREREQISNHDNCAVMASWSAYYQAEMKWPCHTREALATATAMTRAHQAIHYASAAHADGIAVPAAGE
jgi:hypothetical protein